MKLSLMVIAMILSVNIFADNRKGDEVVLVGTKDPDMIQAIKKARQSLEGFLQKHLTNPPNVHTFKLKVMLSDKHGVEHFWVQPFHKTKNDSFEGILANEPKTALTFKAAQKISFKRNMISDWGYVENGKQFGSYTVCVLFTKMPKEQADYYRKNHGFQC